ncbi:zinc finger protein 385C-like isoform X2 [Conger conger]|uniref:zinc finger protein 385C-like isoform X2 n=1 Tax=Conger conger TaxID=82655 RepID=UPI002A5A72ED|nr:zinc finger protein 385C-like isoform X2 [Conger conger]
MLGTADNADIKKRAGTGSPTQSSPLLASLPVPGRPPLQSQLDLKSFLPFPLNNSSPLSLFPNFSTMDPVQKAVINHTFGVPQPLKKKQVISCNICHLRFNSTNQAEAHYKGHKHARKLKAVQGQKTRQRQPGVPGGGRREKEREMERERERERERTSALELPPAPMDTPAMERMCLLSGARLEDSPGSLVSLTPVSELSSLEMAALSSPQASPSSGLSESASESSATESPPYGESPQGQGPLAGDGDPQKNKQHLTCPVCKVTVNSTSQLQAHNSGLKHKLMLGGQSVLPRRRSKVGSSPSACRTKRLRAKASVGKASKAFHCPMCEVHVNSETQLKQHMNSRRHKDRLAGKPPKPKFSPHSKSQQSTVLPSVRWNGCAGGAMRKVFSSCGLASLSPQTKLALQKHLTKSLASGFLPNPLSTATLCTMATGPLTLRHPPATTTFIQAPLLSPALFRPASGPLRATHTPIIFSPY